MSTLPFAFTKPDEPSPIVIAPVNVSANFLSPCPNVKASSVVGI